MKKYIKTSLTYAIVGMVLGVFYREYTKLNDFQGTTRLAVLHPHYLVLGMLFFLIVALLQERTGFLNSTVGKAFELVYHIGLNLTGIMLLVRGLVQVAEYEPAGSFLLPFFSGAPSTTREAVISGLAGVSHIVLGTGIILFFVALLKSDVVKRSAKKK